MPDDERNRRRLGDATRERIADLAEGWSVDAPGKPPVAAPAAKPVAVAAKPAAAAPDAAPVPASGTGPRKKPRTVPPPPPGSAERKALEQAIIDTKDEPAPAAKPAPVAKPAPAAKAAPATKPPPVAKPATIPPPIPALPRGKPPTPPPIQVERTPPVILDDSLTIPGAPPPEAIEPPRAATPPRPPPPPPPAPAARTSDPNLAVPVGEFDSGVATIEKEQLRVAYSQATVKREAADALLQIPDPPDLRGDPTTIDPRLLAGERGDATTTGASNDSKTATGGKLRASAALRRQRGVVGDVRYVFTALFGARNARRELADLEHRQIARQTSRRRHLVTLGRTAISADALDHPALVQAREALAGVEDERSQHAGAVAAADAELDRVRRDRDAKAKQYAADVARCEGELAELAKKLEPLEKEAAGVRRRADELRGALARIDKQLTDTEASLVSVKADRDPAAIQAELATLRADRRAVAKDEPTIAAQLDGLEPRIAALEAARTEAQKRRRELDRDEAEDKRRTSELLEAIGAKRKVVDRAASEAEAARDRVLFELGDRLYVERPKILGAQLSPIDSIDLELGETDRRIMELREILSNIDRAKLLRGLAVIAAGVILAGTIVGLLVYAAA